MALITHGRFRGGSYGFLPGHISTVAARDGTIAMARDGDTIDIGPRLRTPTQEVRDQGIARRVQDWATKHRVG